MENTNNSDIDITKQRIKLNKINFYFGDPSTYNHFYPVYKQIKGSKLISIKNEKNFDADIGIYGLSTNQIEIFTQKNNKFKILYIEALVGNRLKNVKKLDFDLILVCNKKCKDYLDTKYDNKIVVIGDTFYNEIMITKKNLNNKNISISENFKDTSNLKKESFEKLNDKNIRNLPVKTKYQKYAPDIKVYYDYDKIKEDIENFELLSTESGFTSVVNIYQYNDYKIVEKIYKNVDRDSKWYVDNNFVKESYYNELFALNILEGEENFPKILCYDEDNMKIIMTYGGEKISDKNNNINLEKIPTDWKFQLYYILRTLKKHNLYHNDITCRNICINNNQINLIDFGNCKKFIDLYYRNYYTDLILNSENIIDFFNNIDKNAFEIRKCQMK